ncbi:MAG: hypothetical protein LBJ07_03450 [Actinomycetes bacterium]|nr:hypothetical protein [Actinomycetes bacterium]
MLMYNMVDLSRNAKAVVESVVKEGGALISSNGKPKAMMISAMGLDSIEADKMLWRLRMEKAIADAHRASIEAGTDKMTMDEINEMIAEVRAEAHAERETAGQTAIGRHNVKLQAV